MARTNLETKTLTVRLGFNGSLQLLYPGGRTIDLPKGQAEARMLEILEGFRRDARTIQKELETVGEAPEAKRFGFKKPTLTMEELTKLLAKRKAVSTDTREALDTSVGSSPILSVRPAR